MLTLNYSRTGFNYDNCELWVHAEHAKIRMQSCVTHTYTICLQNPKTQLFQYATKTGPAILNNPSKRKATLKASWQAEARTPQAASCHRATGTPLGREKLLPRTLQSDAVDVGVLGVVGGLVHVPADQRLVEHLQHRGPKHGVKGHLVGHRQGILHGGRRAQ